MELNYLREMSVEDRFRSFEQTYVLVSVGQELLAAKVLSFYEDSTVRVKIARNRSEIRVPIDDLRLEQPDLGMFWYRGELYYASRGLERQWRRGFRLRNVIIYKLGSTGRVEQVSGGELERHMVLHFFEGGLAHEAVVSRDFGRRGKLFYFRNIPVGVVEDRVIRLKYNININVEGYEVCQP